MLMAFWFHRASFSVFIGLLTVACARSPRPVLIAIRSAEDTVVLQRQPDKTSFKVTAIVRNLDSRWIQILHCGGADAEREIAGRWVTVFVPVCAMGGSSRLAPGDSLVLPIEVFGMSAQNAAPHLDPRMTSGRYRLRFGISVDSPEPEPPSPIRPIASSPFVVRD